MNTAHLILRTMRDLGADVFWNMPGRAIYPLLNELPGVSGLRHITALHESALTNAADGYARATGRPAWVNLYFSTGLMNGLNGLYMAHRDHIPMVVTATQTESTSVGANNHAECEDVLSLVRPVTKWACQPTRADRVQEALVRAWTIASTPPMGPCFVALPVDFWNEEVPYHPVPETVRDQTVSKDIGSLAELIGAAEAPIIVVGAEAVQLGAMELVENLSERLMAPLFPEPNSSYPAGWRSRMFGGHAGFYKDLVEKADVVLYVNVSTLERGHRKIFMAGRDKQHIQIVTEAKRVNEHIPANWITFGHPRATIEALNNALSMREVNSELIESRGKAVQVRFGMRHRELETKAQELWDVKPMSPARFYSELRKHVPQDAIMVEHVTTSSRVFAQRFPVPSPVQHIAASGSNQGWGIAASVGVKAANPDRPVFAVVGDGGFMFNAQALVTAVTHNLPVIAVVMNNGGWGSMRRSVSETAPKVQAHNLDLHYGWNVDFEAFGKAIGAGSATIDSPEQIELAVKQALASKKCFILNVKVSAAQSGLDAKPR